MKPKKNIRKILTIIGIAVLFLILLSISTVKTIMPGAEKKDSVTAKIEVFEDLNSNGKQDKGEAPIPNTLIVATTNIHGVFSQQAAFTDKNGLATISATYTHIFETTALTPCGYTRTTPEIWSVSSGSPFTKYRFGFQPAEGNEAPLTENLLRFQLWQDINRDGIRQENELPLSNVVLTFAPILDISPPPFDLDQVSAFDNNDLSIETDEAGESILNLGNACGAMRLAPIDGWKTTFFSSAAQEGESGEITVDFDADHPLFEWGLSQYESFKLYSGSAHHPEGMGEWVFFLNTTGALTIRHNVYDESIKYGPYTLVDDEQQVLWRLIADAKIETLPRTFERPGIPDETAYSFSLHTVNDVYLVEMWADDAEFYSGVTPLVEQLFLLLEKYTGEEY